MAMQALLIVLTATAAPQRPTPGGLAGLDSGGPEHKQAAATLEAELLRRINARRTQRSRSPLSANNDLRAFARKTARDAATGDTAIKTLNNRLDAAAGPNARHHFIHAYGRTAGAVLENLLKRSQSRRILLSRFDEVGIGAFRVPAKKPYYQVGIFLVQRANPDAGKPGLTAAQTDPVMARITQRINRECYAAALQRHRDFKAQLTARIRISGQGAIKTLEWLTKSKDALFNRCAGRLVRTAKFPRPRAGKPVTLIHPMRFRTNESKKPALDPSDIRDALGVARTDLRACYEKHRNNPNTAGALEVRLTVKADGRVAAVQILEDTLGIEALRTCVRQRLRQVQFPRPSPSGTTQFVYPLRFATAANGEN